MPGKVVTLIVVVLFFFLHHSGNTGAPREDVLALYREAERLFYLDNPTDATDSIALARYGEIIRHLEKYGANDTLLFQCWLKTGVLLDVKSRYLQAKDAYLTAIRIRGRAQQPDSSLYQAYVYVGTAYYHINHFDSSNYWLLEAEKMVDGMDAVPEPDRLYNALGALYFENGNYVQSRNYFSRALALIRKVRPKDKESPIHFENNIAASYYKLGLYDEAIGLYTKLLPYRLYTGHLYFNLGKAHAALEHYHKAMDCFRQANPNEVPGIFNEMAWVQLQMKRPDSAAWYLDRFARFLQENNRKPRKLDEGMNCIYRSALLNSLGEYEASLEQLQKAIMLFARNFDDADLRSNPTHFEGAFASYKLFDALYRKATTLEQMYGENARPELLQWAHAAYQSTISLLRYIEKSYDTDDARIFLKQNSQNAYQGAFKLCMRLHAQYPGGGYLEQAYLITEKNKASVVAARLTENRLRKMEGIDPALLQDERNIRFKIARLNIQSETETDRQAAEKIEEEKALLEIQLSQVQKRIEQNNSYYKQKYSDSFPTLREIRKHIRPQEAVISFYTTGSALYVFAIARDYFKYTVIDSLAPVKREAETWINRLKDVGSGQRFEAGQTGSRLYRLLVRPVRQLVGDQEEWIIIPDDILHYLPFESLPADEAGTPLLETTAISYHFSSRFILPYEAQGSRRNGYRILAFAPFARQGFAPMDRLPASAGEIGNLPGEQYMDQQATKKEFLTHVNQFPVIHLATHAVADVTNPSGSYIAFYPQTGSPAEDNLYLDELYGLNLDATELVIISACETGSGQLVHSEGIISLSRGFTYAGAHGVINSLWKADDASTAAILKQFHQYLEKGYSRAKALQQAKLDYIRNNPMYKTPDYWAHLILVGNSEPVTTGGQDVRWLALVAGLLVVIMCVIYMRRRLNLK